MRSNDGTGSGWVTRNFNDVKKLDTAEASKIAIDKALQSRNAKAIEPGKYTVILEPAASAELIRNMMFAMNARTADEGRSFLSKKGGGTKLGEKIMDERVTIYTDPFNVDVPAAPWTGDGQARKKMDIIKEWCCLKSFLRSLLGISEKRGTGSLPWQRNYGRRHCISRRTH